MQIEPPELTQYQRDILYHPARFTATEACTKSGKTFSHIYWLFEQSLGHEDGKKVRDVNEGDEYWWVAPVSGQADIAYKRMKRKLQGVEGFLCYDSQGKQRIITPYGSILAFKSADKPDTLYGENVYAAVMDEYTRARQDAWFALRSTLTHTKGPCKFIGNYVGASNWGHVLGKKSLSDPKYAYFKVDYKKAVEAGILDIDEVEQARKDLPRHIFESLYEAKGSSTDDVLFDVDQVLDLWTNTAQRGTKYLSCDIATHGSDRFVLIVWNGWIIEDIIAIDKCSGKEVYDKIVAVCTQYKINHSNIVFDSDGIGGFLKGDSGYLPTAKAFNNGGTPLPDPTTKKPNYTNLKAQCFYLLSHYLNKIEIRPTLYKDEILQELDLIRKGIKKNGKLGVTSKEAIKEVLKRSPDFADALMMRMLFELKGSGIKVVGSA